MARTLEELDRELTSLRAELDRLKREETPAVHPFRQAIGCFTGDEELRRIDAGIEAKCRIPDPRFAGDADYVAA
jgi:hypothetical protein